MTDEQTAELIAEIKALREGLAQFALGMGNAFGYFRHAYESGEYGSPESSKLGIVHVNRQVHLEYECDDQECNNFEVPLLAADLAMDVRYLEEGDLIDCPTCGRGCALVETD